MQMIKLYVRINIAIKLDRFSRSYKIILKKSSKLSKKIWMDVHLYSRIFTLSYHFLRENDEW